jgi:2-alkyl-3-oxoalkanoate reductase
MTDALGATKEDRVDDEPAAARELLLALATTLAAKLPFHLPTWLAGMLAGEHLVVRMTGIRAGSNAKAKSELGWRHDPASWQGLTEVVQQRAGTNSTHQTVLGDRTAAAMG